MHVLLADAPVRREIFETVTSALNYSVIFVKLGVKKAVEIWTEYMTFLRHLIRVKKSKQPKKSFDGLVAVVNDPLMHAKFRFAECVSWQLNEYLRWFHLLPFVREELESLLCLFLEKYILNYILSNDVKEVIESLRLLTAIFENQVN